MLNSLAFTVHFAETEKHPTGLKISGHHNFERGLTAITGKNESGKSLRLEMIRYALFGNKALRGASTTYKSIQADLRFMVNGEDYNIFRKGSKVNLRRITFETDSPEGWDWQELATGTKPVSEAIQKILGYDMEVFDIANACLQGEIEAMTNKKPAERKRMVDRTIGLDSIDKLIEKVNADTFATKQSISLLNDKVIQQYEFPIKPHSYDKCALELHTILEDLQSRAKEKMFIEGKLFGLQIAEPIDPEYDKLITVPLDEMYKALGDLNEKLVEKNELQSQIDSYLKALDQIGDRDIEVLTKYCTEDYVQKWYDYFNYEKSVVEKPKLTASDMEFIRECDFKIKQNHDTINAECPSCETKFKVTINGEIVQTDYDEQRYSSLKQVGGIKNIHDMNRMDAQIAAYDFYKSLPVVEKPDIDHISSPPYQALLKLQEFGDFDLKRTQYRVSMLGAEYHSQTAAINDLIKEKRSQDEMFARYEADMKRYNEYITYKNSVQSQLDKNKYIENEVVTVQALLMEANKYEQGMREWETKVEAQREATELLDTLQMNLEELIKVKKSLNDLKPKVKSHLLPSLNRVASTLLAQMTNNERTSIVIDEDFEILVDGQPVNTLSGSGKAVANLAVRIGLGSVLTNKIFSVFLADEIDAAMDSERAAYTAQCLQNLTAVIGQIILVSHQKPEADHQIEV